MVASKLHIIITILLLCMCMLLHCTISHSYNVASWLLQGSSVLHRLTNQLQLGAKGAMTWPQIT